MEVEVVRSTRRKKTVQAQLINGILRVAIPATLTKAEESHFVDEMRRRFERRASAGPIDLAIRARRLARTYDLQQPASIRWVGNQRTRWGSCTPANGTIRVSDRIAEFPRWVIDYVIVHELAHLSVSGHTKSFWTLVDRYPLAERARGFLIAKGFEPAGNETEPPGVVA